MKGKSRDRQHLNLLLKVQDQVTSRAREQEESGLTGIDQEIYTHSLIVPK